MASAPQTGRSLLSLLFISHLSVSSGASLSQTLRRVVGRIIAKIDRAGLARSEPVASEGKRAHHRQQRALEVRLLAER